MVLLTPSAVSVIISGGVISVFTFLLFLSGYVLQQQTVRSLQEALQAPLEERVRPLQRLPPQYQEQNDTPVILAALEGEQLIQISSIPDISTANPVENVAQVVIVGGEKQQEAQGKDQLPANEPSPQELWHAHIGFQPPEEKETVESAAQTASTTGSAAKEVPAVTLRLAYVFTLPTTQSLCSALLFAKWHRQFSTQSRTSIILLYPSDWEVSASATHVEAMNVLRENEERHRVLLHPVPISKIWTGIDVESQLLSELARNPWNYDRVMYLKSPGMALDITTLDDRLENASPKKAWLPLRQLGKGRGSSTKLLYPDILLWAQGRGLLTPKEELKTLTATARTSHANNHANEIEVEVAAHKAAYVIFDEKELQHRRKEKMAYGGLFERFERDREEVCQGTSLFD